MSKEKTKYVKVTITLPEQLLTKTKMHMENTGKTLSGMCAIGLKKQLVEEYERGM